MRVESCNGDLQLANSGELEVFFLGVGSAFAKTLYQTNFLIVKGDQHLLVDFGMSGPSALRELAGREPTDIEYILPTHSHADHVGGIECLGLMNRYVATRFMGLPKMKMVITEEYQDILWGLTLKGGLAWNEILEDGRTLEFDDYFDPVRPALVEGAPRECYSVNLNGMHIEIFRTRHIPEQADSWSTSMISYGLFIDNRVFVSVDTQFDRELIEQYAERSEVMFHDVQFFPGSVHAPYDDLASLPQSVKDKMYFIHYPDDYRTRDITGFAGFAEQGVRYIFS
jgi:ribonuclease BN (tRNA processing enzyme)